MQPRNIGILGGMSWHSSALYYRLMNEAVANALGGKHCARSVMVTIDYDTVLGAAAAGDWSKVAQVLTDAARSVACAGGECIVIASNTAHIVADEIARSIPLPILHVVDAVFGSLQQIGRAGLLATSETVRQGLYDLKRGKVTVDVPALSDQSDLQAIIRDELSRGQIRSASRRRCEEIAERLARGGSRAIILGCTELSLFGDDLKLSVPVFDSTTLHVQSAVSFALRCQGINSQKFGVIDK